MSMLELLAWFQFNFSMRKTKSSDLAYNTLKTLNSLQTNGIWDTKKMRNAMIILKIYLDDLRKEILN